MPPASRFRKPLVAAAVAVAAAAALWLGSRWVSVERSISQARTALAEHDAGAAITHLRNAKRYRPDDPEVEFLLARVARRQGRTDDVRTHLERAWKLGYPEETIRREEWLTLAQNGQLREAEPHLPELLTDPGDDAGEICEAYVTGYLRTHRFQRALELLDAWQADAPDDPQPHFLRGAYAEHIKAAGKAISEFEAALSKAPERDDIRLRLASVLTLERRYEEAGDHFRILLDRVPGNPDVQAGWGTHLLAQGRLDEAGRAFDRALAEHPDHFEARFGRGRVELQRGDPKEAVRWLSPLATDQPRNVELRYALGSALAASGNPQAAKPHFDFVAEARPAMDRADALADRILADPTDIEARYEVGSILLKYDSPADGVAWLRGVLDIRPDHRPTHLALADYYEEIGDRELARRHRRLAGPAEAAADGEPPPL